ncbi:MAG: hypothetical protein HYT79_08610 [Elusimicrobia bacterium]|nr:hypothetical protein [Elusimicrobiota bacterium]
MRPFAIFFLLAWTGLADAERLPHEVKPGILRPSGLFVLFYDSKGPLNYATLTHRGLPHDAEPIGEIKEKSCQFGLSIPLGIPYASSRSSSISSVYGDSSFVKMMGKLRSRYPDLTGIYDVKMDKHTIRVLGIFTRMCIEVTAQGFK